MFKENNVLFRYQPKQEDSTEKKVELFTKSLEELKGKEGSSPSVFRDWFVRTFPDPQVCLFLTKISRIAVMYAKLAVS